MLQGGLSISVAETMLYKPYKASVAALVCDLQVLAVTVECKASVLLTDETYIKIFQVSSAYLYPHGSAHVRL